MSPNAKEIFVGTPDRITGAVMNAPVGTALPVGVNGSVSAFTDCGYISDAGLKTSNKLTVQTVRDWGGDIIRSYVQSTDGIISLTFLETNTQTTAAFWGGTNVTVTAPTGSTGNVISVAVNGQDPNHFAWVFNVKDGIRKKRLTVPDGQVMMRGDVTYTKAGAVMYTIDITCYPDASGNLWYEVSDDGLITGSSVASIVSVTPAGKGANGIVRIQGSGFTGTSAVTFGGTAATAYDTISDTLIEAELPVGSAGVVAVVVTNPSGASAAVSYTRAT